MITLRELGQGVLAGQLLISGEVRAADVREAGYVDKKTGLAASTLLITYFLERFSSWGYEIVKVTRRAPDGVADPASVPLLAQKGRTYAFEILSFERKPGLRPNLVYIQTTPRTV